MCVKLFKLQICYRSSSYGIVRSVVMGHLAWTGQNASGNRADDFRALKISELQPYTFLHPNGETGVQAILGLQGEEKAGAGRGMRTVRIFPYKYLI